MIGRVASTVDWERAAVGWERHADAIRTHGMPVSVWMLDALALHPGERVLELAAGPGDTGFLAAEQILPGGGLICSDSSEAMLAVARRRAAAQRVDNIEFKELSLDWIDLPTASVDAILCRWGLMLSPDPGAALQDWRRVLRPGGRAALAVWDGPDGNPWTTIPSEALADLGLAPVPDRDGPGMFALRDGEQLDALLAGAGFVERTLEAVALERGYPSVQDWIAESVDISAMLGAAWRALSDLQRRRALDEIARRAAPFTDTSGAVRLPGSALCALADA